MDSRGTDEPRVLAICDVEGEPLDFMRRLLETLVPEKARTRSFGRTLLSLKWKAGELDELEITDGVTIKFRKK